MWKLGTSLVGKLFGNSKFISGSMSMIDDVFYTDQEKAEQKIKLLEGFEPFKLALRLIALSIVIPVVAMVMLLVVCNVFGWGTAAGLTAAYVLIKDTLAIPFAMVIGFYFADGVGVFKGKKKIKDV